jgi:hypothetical protein
MSLAKSLGSGLIGACALTLLHETARRFIPDAPRMDVLGMRAIAKSMRLVDQEPPADEQLQTLALAGDVLSNSLYYSLVGAGAPCAVWLRGVLLGLGAGVGAVVLPQPLGLGSAPRARSRSTQAMTVGWYLAGGLAAAAAFQLLSDGSCETSEGRSRR